MVANYSSLFLLLLAVTIETARDGRGNSALYDFELDIDRLPDKRTVAVSAEPSKNDPSTIDVAAFNVRIFGRRKVSDSFVVDKLTKIILRYDLILIQEIRDSSQTAIHKLLQAINSKSGAVTYSMVLSARLGRSSSKEQYAYIYRSDIFSVTNQYVYDDSANDIFEREPFVVKFSSSIAAVPSFIAIGIHTAPKDATSEIDHLVDVYDDAKTRLGTSNAILMGDFNAGCSYVSSWSSIRLATDHRFYWLINDVSDTTSGGTECAYDRLVVVGTEMIDAVEPLSPSVFHYDQEYTLSSDAVNEASTTFMRDGFKSFGTTCLFKEATFLEGISFCSTTLVKSKRYEDCNDVLQENRNRTFNDLYQKEQIMKALKVSDHYPVQMKIRTKQENERISLKRSIKVDDKDVIATVPTIPQNLQGYNIINEYGGVGNLLSFTLKFPLSNLSQSMKNLLKLKIDMGDFISTIQVSSALRHLKEVSMIQFLPKNNGVYFTLKDYYNQVPHLYTIMAKCQITRKRCTLIAEIENGF